MTRHTLYGVFLLIVACLGNFAAAAGQKERTIEHMLAEIASDFRATADLTGLDRMSESVEAAMRAVARESFVDEADRSRAYVNRPLGIGHGQTISQPFIVALMTELLAVRPGQRVLEIGTGSGYQAAVLAELGAEVYSIEIVEPLAIAARERLASLGYGRVRLAVGDGRRGWPDAAPFDGIIVTAGGDLPDALVAQLAPGGRMVIPVTRGGWSQELQLIVKDDQGRIRVEPKLPVRFVPLTGGSDRTIDRQRQRK